MPKFSIVIPVYNVENYLNKCLDSILNQTYKDYEVIIVNDGSTDNSLSIIENYESKFKNIDIINQENRGLSVARNEGIKKVNGEYFILIDSDDYIENNLLEELNKSIKNTPDLVRFQMRTVEEKEKIDYKEESFNNLNGKDAFNIISKYHFVEPACCYLYKTDYFKNNEFEFKKGLYHEDFGLIPLVIVKADIVNSISFIGYNYIQRKNSIMNTEDYMKIKKKAFDTIEHYKFLNNFDGGSVYKSFIANSLILKLKGLNKKDFNEFNKQIKKIGAYDGLLDNTIQRKIKKIILKISPRLYLKMR